MQGVQVQIGIPPCIPPKLLKRVSCVFIRFHVLIIKKAYKGTKILARMQGARARNLRKVKKMQKIYELSIGICTSDRRIIY